MSEINRNEFQAALGRLEGLAKSQLYHTAGDSNPGTWAGTSQTDQDEHSDGIDDNGTDYNGVKKALALKVAKSKALTPSEVAIVKGEDPRRLIANKIAKGGKLTQAESWAIKKGFPFEKDGDDDDDDMDKTKKSGTAKASTSPSKASGGSGEDDDAKNVPDTNAGKDTDNEIEPDAKKSLGAAISGSSNLKKSIDMSPVLYEFARAIGQALEGTEARTTARITKSLAEAFAPLVHRVANLEKGFSGYANDQGNFNKGFAEAVIGIGQQLVGGSEVAAHAANMPAGGPKSQLRSLPGGGGVQAVQKSFGPGGLDTSTDQLNKAQITDVMFELVKKGQMNQLDVVKFDATGEMSPAVRGLVAASMGGTR
jgi:hypothetical protein